MPKRVAKKMGEHREYKAGRDADEMDFKENAFKFEEQWLSGYAAHSKQSKGRLKPCSACELRTDYQRDRDRIIHCKAFRRLKHKTQVFLAPEGDYYRTRLTHTLEVSQIARTIAFALRLNGDLTEAVALAHDLGHTPFGHAGERALSRIVPFKHNEHSLRVVDVLENDGKGLNLTYEVRDGIINHTSAGNPSTLEGETVRWSDKIAYINHDIDDALRGGVLKESDIPKTYGKVFGHTHGERINTMIMDIINNSCFKPHVSPSEDMKQHIMGLRQFLFERVYLSGAGKSEESKAESMIEYLFEYFRTHADKMPKEYMLSANGDADQAAVDYVASMSDNFAIRIFQEITVPKGWSIL